MGLTITCDFCGATHKSYHRLFIYDLDDPNTKSKYCACDECLQKHIIANIKHISPPVTESVPSNGTSTHAFQGMKLRDFLRTDYYLTDTETVYIFQTQTGDTILNMQKWLGKPIVNMSKKNQNGEVIVMIAEHVEDK